MHPHAKLYVFVTYLLALPILASADQSSYQNNILTISRVDSPEQVGQYQDASLRLQTDGTWLLTSVQALNSAKLGKASVSTVEVVTSGTLPVGVFLRASGVIPTCGFEDPVRVHQRREGTQFEIGISTLYSDHTAEQIASGTVVCPAIIETFKVTVPLEVYGLSAGTYTYDVNGVAGSFTLGSNNKFPDDCDTAASIGMCPYLP